MREELPEARSAELEACMVRLRLLQTTPTAALVGYRIGAAAKEFLSFEGMEDGAAYILELTHLLGKHREVLVSGRAN